ncbi:MULTISPECIES: hypothetical protein [unclassified Variovorax]|uniref:DUF6950 family protein n=1 Tax=unclassified Variovorax TaxID=663243 RepID=UPI002575170F|nr:MULTISPECIES: hypothetical protein [unclassified Variovorax]MDM0086747.1 hypothetical protein [Variovorax sp. J22G40]MDM0144997.1 hypothetical protein [Variovorax sp. J2P1-31]
MTGANLDAFIAERRSRPFEYFHHDCVLIAAEWVIAKTGTDPLSDLRAAGGIYDRRNLLTALRLVRSSGGFEAVASARLGAAHAGLMAQRGDVVLARSGRRVGRVSGYSFGICTGSHLVVPGDDRLEFLPLTAGVASWRL